MDGTTMAAIAPIDLVVAAIIATAVVRGLWLGLIREAFSIAALAGAVIAVRLFADPVGAWIGAEAAALGYALGDWTARVAAAVLLVVGVLAGVGIAGRVIRRGARAVGLGFADRLGGGVLGAAEGLLVAALVVALAATLLGRDHTVFEGSQALAALDEARRSTPDVAAAPD